MVVTLSLLKCGQWGLFLISAFLLIIGWGEYFIPFLLLGMLASAVTAIPFEVAWNKSFAATFRSIILTIAFIILFYGFILFNQLINESELKNLSPLEAFQISVGAWTGSSLPSRNLNDAWFFITMEKITSYFSLSILVAVIVLWVTEALKTNTEYVNWLESIRPVKTKDGLKPNDIEDT